jgi:alkanesulfonate monooxygenase SsuD/methylene tetrahydromethanopterin reductase-like flavin-dependent oxidoreductase (luciferase family)
MHVGLGTGFANHAEIDDRQFVKEEMRQILYGEELGFESIWMTEHHFSDYSVSPSPMQYLSWLAGKTRTMRLGTSVIVVPWHDPVRVAEEIAVLDHLSDGRAIIGFGRGLGRMEYEGFRVDQARAREIFDESVPIILKALETGFIEGGATFKIPRRELRPRPFRSLIGRAFIAAGTDASMIAGAKLGLGRLYLGQPNVSAAAQAAKEAGKKQAFSPLAPAGPAERRVEMPLPNGTYAPDGPWDQAWKESFPNIPPTAPFVLNLVVIDESRDRAEEMARKYSERNFHWIAKNYSITESFEGLKGYEQYKYLNMTQEQVNEAAKHAYQSTIFGTPKDVLEQMDRSLKDLNPQGFAPTMWMGGMPHDEVMRSLKLFAEKCLPELKSWNGAEWTIDHANKGLGLAA